MSGDFQDVCLSLTFLQCQPQRAVERAHQTLKTMFQTFSVQFFGKCDVALPFLVFAEKDPVSESIEFPHCEWTELVHH